jgi:hypothetical protein
MALAWMATRKHALHGVLAENDLLAIHSIDQLISFRRLPPII